MNKTFIAASTAIVMTLTAVAATTPATAAPLNLGAKIETQGSIETVGNRNGRNAAAAIIGLSAFAIGAAAVASGTYQEPRRHRGYRDDHGEVRPVRESRRRCHIERTERWSNRRGAYVITKEKVCY